MTSDLKRAAPHASALRCIQWSGRGRSVLLATLCLLFGGPTSAQNPDDPPEGNSAGEESIQAWTAAEIREATAAGVFSKYKVTEYLGEKAEDEGWELNELLALTDQAVTTRITKTSRYGRTFEPEVETLPWDEWLANFRFEKATTQVNEQKISVEAGTFDCKVFRTDWGRPEEGASGTWIAFCIKDRPGQCAVYVSIEKSGGVVMLTRIHELVELKDSIRHDGKPIPLPWTAADIRTATRKGSWAQYKDSSGSQTIEKVTGVSKNDCEQLCTQLSADGTVIGDAPQYRTTTWTERAAVLGRVFRESNTTVADETITVAAGEFDCRVYTHVLENVDTRLTTTYCLAKGVPGCCVRFIGEGKATETGELQFHHSRELVKVGAADPTEPAPELRTAEVRKFEGHTDHLNSAAWSPDGKFVLTGSSDKTARLWDVETGKEVRRFDTPEWPVEEVAFSADGKQFLTLGIEIVRLWNVASGAEIRRFGCPGAHIEAMAISPDGKFLLLGASDKTARLWNTATGTEIRKIEGHENRVSSVSFSADGATILTGSWDRTGRLWEAASGKEIRRFQSWSALMASKISHDGRFVLASGGQGDAAILWDCASGNEVRRFHGHTSLVSSIAFSPNDRYVLTASMDETARLWDAATGRELRVFEGHTDDVESAVFSPDGKRILTVGRDNTARLWDAD